jgi:hypothetical protein
MSYKIANLINNELASIFGGDCTCYCVNYTINFSILKKFLMQSVASKAKCDKLCEKYDDHVCKSKTIFTTQISNKLLDAACFTPIYDRSSSAYEHTVK